MARGKSVLTSMRFGCTALVALAAAKDWDPSAMVSEEGCGASYRRTLREREGFIHQMLMFKLVRMRYSLQNDVKSATSLVVFERLRRNARRDPNVSGS